MVDGERKDLVVRVANPWSNARGPLLLFRRSVHSLGVEGFRHRTEAEVWLCPIWILPFSTTKLRQMTMIPRGVFFQFI